MSLVARLEAATAAGATAAGEHVDPMDSDPIEIVEEGSDEDDADPSQLLVDDPGSDDDDDLTDDADDDAPAVEKRDDPAHADDRSFSRVLRTLGSRERALAEERSARRDDQARIKELESQINQSAARNRPTSDDPIESLIQGIMRQCGADDPSDPRVRAAVQQAAVDLTLEAYPDAAKESADLRERLDSRRRGIQEKERFRDYDRRLDEMQSERLRAQRDAQIAGLHEAETQFLADSASNDGHPYLRAAIDAGEVQRGDLLRIATKGVQSGQFRDPADNKELSKLYAVIAENLDDHYRTVADKLNAPGQRRQGGSPVKQPANGIARQTKEPKRSVDQVVERVSPSRAQGSDDSRGRRATRGGGGRGAAPPDQARGGDDEGPGDLAARIARAERRARAGRLQR